MAVADTLEFIYIVQSIVMHYYFGVISNEYH